MDFKAATIANVCDLLIAADLDAASTALQENYPFNPSPMVQRRYDHQKSTRLFIRDGFIDRYTGMRLIFPPVLRVLSISLPELFPFHRNWKTDVTHPAYWALSPTVDHILPVSRGGADDESNWVTTSMARNSAKLKWTLDELGWELHAAGDIDEWDGMLGWFLAYTRKYPEIVKYSTSILSWHKAGLIYESRIPSYRR